MAGNESITFSAGIGIFRNNFPVIKASSITEEFLEDAKSLVYPKDEETGIEEESPSKNKITILGEVFSWEEFDYLNRIRDIIVQLISEDENKSRGILQKVINSTKGFKPILDEAQNRGRIQAQKVWRMSYYLRNIGGNSKKANELKEKLIKIYENMWMHDFFRSDDSNKKIKNHQLITVAAKLADLQTRTSKSK